MSEYRTVIVAAVGIVAILMVTLFGSQHGVTPEAAASAVESITWVVGAVAGKAALEHGGKAVASAGAEVVGRVVELLGERTDPGRRDR